MLYNGETLLTTHHRLCPAFLFPEPLSLKKFQINKGLWFPTIVTASHINTLSFARYTNSSGYIGCGEHRLTAQ